MANQKAAGAQDPAAAAQLAGMSQGNMQETVERMAEANAKLDEMREELLVAAKDTGWRPPNVKGDVASYIENLAPPLLTKLHAEWQEESEKEIIEEAQKGEDPFVLTPDHPAYQPIMDMPRRNAINAKLKAMDFGELIFKGFVEQEVPIRQDFKLSFRSISTQHGLWLEQRAGVEREGSYDRHLFSLWQLAVGLHSAGGKPIGLDISAMEKREDFNEELDRRMKVLGRWPLEFSSDLIVHYIWFTGRVRKLLHGNLMEKVGN